MRPIILATVMAAALLVPAAPAAATRDAKCVSVAEAENTVNGETRAHAERRFGAPGHPYHGRFEVFPDGSGHRKYWRSYDKCGGSDDVRFWVEFKNSGPNRVIASVWVYLP